MNIVWTHTGVSIGRDTADGKAYKESTVIFRFLQMMNSGDHGKVWRRFYPNRHGLTDCRTGVRNRITGEAYWHGNYQIENAAEAWNSGNLFLNKA